MKWSGMLSVANATLLPFFTILGQMTTLQAAEAESLGRSKCLSFADGPFNEFGTFVQVVRLLTEETRLVDSCRRLFVLSCSLVLIV